MLDVKVLNEASAPLNVSATQSGTWTVQQGTPPWTVSQSGTWNIGTVTTVTGVTAVTSLTQMNGQAISMGTGVRDAGTQRVTIATNDVVPVTLVPKSTGIFCINIPSQVHVASANTVHWDLFNADATLVVRVLSIRQRPNITTAVTGIVFDWLLERTTAVGTGGSTLTPFPLDTSATALDADITTRSKPTGGATQSTDIFNYSLSSEETNAGTIQIASQGGLELVPPTVGGAMGIVLRQNQGLRCVQITSSIEGNTGWSIIFQVE